MKSGILVLILASAAMAQGPDLKTIPGHMAAVQGQVKNNIIRSAEKMPEENYSYKPTPDIRSFGEILAHVADAQYLFCSAALGEKNPSPGVEKNKHTKAEITGALEEAFAYCDRAYNGMTDANMGQVVKALGADRSRAGLLAFNTDHAFEHYGNLVTYLRLKGIVPPSSEPRK